VIHINFESRIKRQLKKTTAIKRQELKPGLPWIWISMHIGRQILTPQGAKTPEPILMKLGMVD